MIVGIGVDVVDVSRLARMMVRSEAFERYVFSTRERVTAAGRPSKTARLAAYLAAKEALLKALGVGLMDDVPLREVEVVGDGPASSFQLSARALLAAGRGNWEARVCMSGDSNMALAFVVVEREEAPITPCAPNWKAGIANEESGE